MPDNTTIARAVAARLAAELGADRVLVDDEAARDEYARDRWARGWPPSAVFLPRTPGEVSAVAAACHAAGLPMVPRGGGSGMSGGAVPLDGAAVVSLARLDRIERIDREALYAVVGPGVVLQDFQRAVAAVGLLYPPDPASAELCTLGGNVAENAGGPSTVKYGVTGDYVLGLDVVLADGTPLTLGSRARKDVTGLDLKRLFVGSEGLLGFVTGITLRLAPRPEASSTFRVFLRDAGSAARLVQSLLGAGILPAKAEFLDATCLRLLAAGGGMAFPAGSGAALLVALDGSVDGLVLERARVRPILAGAPGVLAVDEASGETEAVLWETRTKLSPALKAVAPLKVNEDVAVPLDRLPDLVAACEALAAELDVVVAVFGHAGDGNLHVNFLVDVERAAVAEEGARRLFDAVLAAGGAISGEHGIGIAKAAYAAAAIHPAALELMRGVKSLFDPRGLLNPGKALYGPLAARHVRERVI